MKVGDKVTLIRSGVDALCGFEDGDEVKIIDINESDILKFTVAKGDLTGFTKADNLKAKENTMTKFKVGDRVKIAESSRYYTRGNESNPRNTEGTIHKVRDSDYGFGTQVDWDNNTSNSYNISDLELVEKSLDNLAIGDVIVDRNGEHEREVVAVGPEYIGTIDKYDNSDDKSAWKTAVLKEGGYKVKQEPQFVEVTLADIAGKFDISIDKLRIKE